MRPRLYSTCRNLRRSIVNRTQACKHPAVILGTRYWPVNRTAIPCARLEVASLELERKVNSLR